ncbi:hypothetical protein G210_5724 [Candida maltosa Xu316]|uniref:Uncharacterized protein n=1 Tax=Candida maltosa (strain Xu316) TaxID=1245528 RepID=M3K2J6_CANMX|nr:hypothetical protein G210_5724 [Candida maltosa Xu316]
MGDPKNHSNKSMIQVVLIKYIFVYSFNEFNQENLGNVIVVLFQ